jgi:hypothetical protein
MSYRTQAFQATARCFRALSFYYEIIIGWPRADQVATLLHAFACCQVFSVGRGDAAIHHRGIWPAFAARPLNPANE